MEEFSAIIGRGFASLAGQFGSFVRDAWFYGWPYLVILAQVGIALWVAKYLLYDWESKKRRKEEDTEEHGGVFSLTPHTLDEKEKQEAEVRSRRADEIVERLVASYRAGIRKRAAAPFRDKDKKTRA